ncbi:hypothetical protein ABPG72_017898 [Tetrahymena utriculariae]
MKDRTLQTYFLNRKVKYFYYNSDHSFQALQLDIEGKQISQIAQGQPLNSEDIDQKMQLFGKSCIEIKVPNYFEYMGSQLLQPMNFIFYFGLVVLVLQLFYSFIAIAVGALIFIMSIIYWYIRKTKNKLKEACQHNLEIQVQRSYHIQTDSSIKLVPEIQVRRQNRFQAVSSMELVPGDINIIEKNITLPFDCILLEGQMQVNEENITGESIPVIKNPLCKQQIWGHNLFIQELFKIS